jgi:sugar phosphate isomerase/epimerase
MELGVYSLVTPDYPAREAAALIADVGYTGIEWTVDYPNALWDGQSNWHIDTGDLERSAREAREAAEACGLRTVALGTRCGCFDAAQVRLGLRVAGMVGAGAIRVHAPDYDGSTHCRELMERAREAFAALQEEARRSGVRVWTEIHNGRLCPSASAARRLLEGLDPEWIGVIFDPGNMVREGMEAWRMGVELLGPYLQHVHVKDAGWFRGDDGRWRTENMSLEEGMVEWPELIDALRSVDYEGFLNIEDFRGGYMNVSEELPTRRKLQEDYDYLSGLL